MLLKRLLLVPLIKRTFGVQISDGMRRAKCTVCLDAVVRGSPLWDFDNLQF